MPYGFTQLVNESMSAVTATNTVELGTIYQSGMLTYVHVYNAGTSTANVGYGVVRTNMSAGSVTVSAVTNESKCVGIVKNAQLEPLYYGWVVCAGPVSCYSANGGIGAGEPVALNADGTVEAVLTSSSQGYGIGVVLGTALTAIASGATGNVWVSCLGN